MNVDNETYTCWANEQLAIPSNVAEKLKAMFCVYMPIEAHFDADTMVKCLVGTFPHLEGEAPIDLFAIDSKHTLEESLRLGSQVLNVIRG